MEKSLLNTGMRDIVIPEIKELTMKNIEIIKDIVRFRAADNYDFEYGIGGFGGDEYYKIKNIKFYDNNTNIVVRVSKV